MSKPSPITTSIFQRMLVWLYTLLVLTTPLFFTFDTDELFEFNKMMLTYVFATLIVTVWLGRMVFEKRIICRHTKLDYLIGFFLLTQLISTITSIHPYTSFFGYYSRFHGGLASSTTYALLYWAAIANLTRRDLRGIFLSSILAGALVSLYAIGEHFGHSVSCLMSSGGTSFGVDCWVQDVQHRVFATFGQPNWLAAYALMLLSVVTGVLMTNWPTRWERWAYYASFVLLLLTLLYTRSRSGFLGFVAAMLVLALGMGVVWWLKKENQFSSRVISIILGVTAACVLVVGTPFTPSLQERLTRSETVAVASPDAPVVNRLDIGGTDSGEIRKIVWQGAIDVWRRYPLTGSGVETFGYSYYQDRPEAHNLVSEWDFLYNKAHNEFLNFLATTGALGLLSYVALLVGYAAIATLGFIRLVQKEKYDRAVVILGLMGAVAGLSVSNFFGFSTVVVTVLQYLAYAATMILLLPTLAPPKPVKEIAIWQFATLVLVIVGAVFPLSRIFNMYRADKLYTSAKSLMDQGQIQPAAINLTRAISLSPREALFWDELSQLYSQAAVSYAQTQVNTDIPQIIAEAIAASDKTMELNDRQLNFYKTRARTFIILSQIDEAYNDQAIAALEKARELSPTDPKILYNMGLLKLQRGDTEGGIAHLEQAAELKPNYVAATTELANQLWLAGRKQDAIDRMENLILYEPTISALQATVASYSAALATESGTKK